MVLYLQNIPIKNYIITDILPLIILFIILSLPYFVYFNKSETIILVMVSFLFITQCIALYYNVIKYPL